MISNTEIDIVKIAWSSYPRVHYPRGVIPVKLTGIRSPIQMSSWHGVDWNTLHSEQGEQHKPGQYRQINMDYMRVKKEDNTTTIGLMR